MFPRLALAFHFAVCPQFLDLYGEAGMPLARIARHSVAGRLRVGAKANGTHIDM